jgi:hypothetical protein
LGGTPLLTLPAGQTQVSPCTVPPVQVIADCAPAPPQAKPLGVATRATPGGQRQTPPLIEPPSQAGALVR